MTLEADHPLEKNCFRRGETRCELASAGEGASQKRRGGSEGFLGEKKVIS